MQFICHFIFDEKMNKKKRKDIENKAKIINYRIRLSYLFETIKNHKNLFGKIVVIPDVTLS